MRARVVRIGNSRGVRIPKPLIEQVGLQDEVEIAVEGSSLIIRAAARLSLIHISEPTRRS